MRIYDLAKEMGQKLSVEIKSAKLADEFRTMPQFAAIHDTIKSHASIVDDEHAQLMFKIYKERYGKNQPERTSETGSAVKTVSTPSQPTLPKAQPTPPPAVAKQPLPRPGHPALPPRPAPIQAGGVRPVPIPAVPRPAPIQAAPTSPAAPASAPAHPAAPVAKVAPVAPAAPAAPATPAAPVAPAAPAAPVTPVAPVAKAAPGTPPQAAPSTPPRPVAPTRPMGRERSDQGGQGARPGAEAPRRPGQPSRPGQGQQGQQGQGRSQKFRPSGLAAELKSSSGTTGVSALPDSEKARQQRVIERTAGQPAAPAMPKFSTDSPFVKPVQPRRPEPRPRPSERPGERPGERTDRPARTGEQRYDRPDRGGPPRGDRPDRGGPSRPETGAPDRRKRPTGPAEPPVLTVPEIGVMKLKPKRHRPGATPEKPAKGGARGAEEANKAAKAKLPLKGGKKLAPSKVYGDADEFRRPLKALKRPRPQQGGGRVERHHEEPAPKTMGPVVLTGPLTVGAFAEKLNVPPSEVIKRAFLKGKAITINQLINLELAEELAFDLEIDLSIQLEGDESDLADFREIEDRPEDLVPRPPVVTIMGHVDHGKTTLLDYFRRSQVVEGEFGGITQHIGAYHVATSRGDIVFLDTPGHEAFTAMRARGVQCTDIVVLVVSADDGVMPQTIEAINHAKAANVPIIVAINKIDLPQANPERVRTELLQYSVVPTHLGGDTEFVEISAKKGLHMDELLEIINLQAAVLELKTNPNRPAEGVVIESHVDPLRGAVATILVQKGTLKVSQPFVVGAQSGRVRAMLDDHGRPLEEASLGHPVELMGLSGPPEVGEILLVMEDERKAREIAERREQRRRLLDLGTTRQVTLEGLHDMIAEGKIKELNVILKADVQGSIEAITQALEKLGTGEIRIRVLHSGTGSVTDNDVNLAMASSAIIIGFNIRPEQSAAELAQREGVEIKLYRIIYELLEDVEKAMVGMLEKRFKENVQGRTEVRQVFHVSRAGTVAGCMVLSGEIQRNALCRLIRDGKVVYEGKVASLRRVKEDVAKVAAGFECGVMLDKFSDVKERDIIENYTLEEIPAELSRAQL